MIEIFIATGNPGKAREIISVLSQPLEDRCLPTEIRWTSLKDWPTPIVSPPEDQDTFAGNAALKARYYSGKTGLWTLADDSGLEVDALEGAPGVQSARYADLPDNTPRSVRDLENNRKLIARLQGVASDKRTARFRCAMALADGQHVLATSQGVIEGRIIDQPRGREGFGYDPYFLVPDLGRTTAELSPEHKNRISHRGQALREMQRLLPGLLEKQSPQIRENHRP